MKALKFVALLSVFISTAASGQNTYTAILDGGLWNNGLTWSCAGTSCGTELFPQGGDDDVYIPSGIRVTVNAAAQAKNLALSYDTEALNISGATITVTGTLWGWDSSIDFPAQPITDVIAGTPSFIFTGVNTGTGAWTFGNEIINYWNELTPLGNVQFNLAADASLESAGIFGGTVSPLSFSSFLVRNAFTLSVDNSVVSSLRVTALSVLSNATLNLTVPVVGTAGLVNSQFGGLVLNNGSLITSAQVNNATTSLVGTSVLETSFSGTGQDQGWWYGTAAPTLTSMPSTMTIRFTSSSPQNIRGTIGTQNYSNLTLSGGTKTLTTSTLTATGTLNIDAPLNPGVASSTITSSGVLNINSTLNSGFALNFSGTSMTVNSAYAPSGALNLSGNTVQVNANFTPSSMVVFSGTSAQSFEGSGGTVTFGGGVNVNKSAGTLTFNRASTISSSLSVATGGTLNLGDVTTTLNAMSVSNSGTITSGDDFGTIVAQGAVSFTGSGSLTLNNITASSGVTFGASANIAITGNVTNNSSITFPTSGTVTFNGSNNQSLSGNSMSIVNMTVNKPTGTLTNNTTLTLIGLLTMQSGTFDADGSGSSNFILYSDANQDARIGAMSGGIITGNVVFQRYFVNSSTAWRNFSFPVNSVPVSELTDDITVVNGSLAYYTESTLGNVDQGWTTVATNGTLTASRGYSAYMYYSGNYTIDVRGTLLANQPTLAGASAYNYGVTFTDDPAFDTGVNDGWNLLPNPYACPINWNAASGWQKTNVNGAAAIWDGNNLTYRYSNGVWDGVIAQGQAFWVQTTGSAPVLTSTESVKVSSSDPVFYRTGNSEEKMFINLTSEGKTDVLTVGFNEEATAGFDSQYDANKLKNRIFNFSAIGTDGSTLAVSVMPKSACANAIQLKLTDTKAGEYTMSFERVNTLLDVNKITITDRFTEKTVTVTDASTYNFTITSDPRSADPTRFVMNIEFADPELATPQIIANGTELRTNIRNGVQWFLNGEAIPGATNPVLNTTQNGLYQVKVMSQGCEAASEALRLTEQRAGRFYPNPAEGIIKADLSNLLEQARASSGTIEFYSVSGVLVKTVNFGSSDFSKSIDVDQLPKGHYLVKVKSSSDKTMVQERVVIK